MRKKLDAYFNGLIESRLTPCLSIAVVKNSRPVYSFCQGRELPDDPESKKVTPTTRMNLGSTTKPFTAALVVKLAEEGRLALLEPVKKYIPEFKSGAITILQLMTHSSGYATSQNVDWPRKAEDLKGYFHKIYGSEPLNPPGETVEYWSVGYSVLMDIIQRVTGQDIQEYAREALFEPLGMRHTTYRLSTLKPAEFILPWDGTGTTDFLLTAPPTCDTALYSTAADLVKFGTMILNGGRAGTKRIFSTPAVDCMLRERPVKGQPSLKTPVFWIQSNTGIEYGCFGDLNSPRAVGHPGYTGCMLMIDPAYRVTVAILSNSIALHADYNNYKKINNVVLSSL